MLPVWTLWSLGLIADFTHPSGASTAHHLHSFQPLAGGLRRAPRTPEARMADGDQDQAELAAEWPPAKLRALVLQCAIQAQVTPVPRRHASHPARHLHRIRPKSVGGAAILRALSATSPPHTTRSTIITTSSRMRCRLDGSRPFWGTTTSQSSACPIGEVLRSLALTPSPSLPRPRRGRRPERWPHRQPCPQHVRMRSYSEQIDRTLRYVTCWPCRWRASIPRPQRWVALLASRLPAHAAHRRAREVGVTSAATASVPQA